MNKFLFLFFFCFFACKFSHKRPNGHEKLPHASDTSAMVIDKQQTDPRSEYVARYANQVIIDTLFNTNGKKYRVVLRHFCTMDGKIKVPAAYNPDTHKDFVTHDFKSKLLVFSDGDMLYIKTITRQMFDGLLDQALKNYGVLLNPRVSLTGENINIQYDISIPVTNVVKTVSVTVNPDGSYQVRQLPRQ